MPLDVTPPTPPQQPPHENVCGQACAMVPPSKPHLHQTFEDIQSCEVVRIMTNCLRAPPQVKSQTPHSGLNFVVWTIAEKLPFIAEVVKNLLKCHKKLSKYVTRAFQQHLTCPKQTSGWQVGVGVKFSIFALYQGV
jgi:hypothetical protein